MKKLYLYAGIAAWIFFMLIIGLAIMGSQTHDSTDKGTVELRDTVHQMHETVTHLKFDEDAVAVNVVEASMVIDEKTPKSTIFGFENKDREAGQYTLTLTIDITNLSESDYVHNEYGFKVEDDSGKRFEPAPRLVDARLLELKKGQSAQTKIHYDIPPPMKSYTLVLSSNDVETRISLNELQKLRPSLCEGNADCIAGFVSKVIDGDTLDIRNVENDEEIRIRLALVDTPEKGEENFDNASKFTEGLCPVGSYALFDEDDGQTEGSFGREIGLVYCEGILLNEKLVEHKLATIDPRFCGQSEYAQKPWAINACEKISSS